MKLKLFSLLFAILLSTTSIFAQTSWLDRPITNWNTTNIVPTAPRASGDAATIARCKDGVRVPESIADRALTRVGWTLFGASQTYGTATVINAMASVDGMCRPNQFNTFVFVSGRFVGTLSPTPMLARNDGALYQVNLLSPTAISAEFSRYTSSDALCCPSQKSTVLYTLTANRVTANNVETEATCQNGQNPNNPDDTVEAGTVRGTINYRSRGNFQRNGTLTVRLVDVTIPNTLGITVGEQRIEITNQQPPIPFEIKVNQNRIDQRRKYAVQAELAFNGRTVFAADRIYSVLTQGNPNVVDLNLVPINQIGNNNPDTGTTRTTVRGTVSYRERIALPNNASITVRLIDGSFSNETTTSSTVVAETTFSNNNRQVPLPFELSFNQNQIDTRRNYYLQAEISVDGRTRFVTNTNYPVLTQGNPSDNIQLVLVSGVTTSSAITGQTLSLSKFGTGSIQIEGRSSEFLLRGNVEVLTDGTADVTVSRFSGGIPFSGKLTYFDQNTLRITVENSGNANASGEIEIRYTGRRIDSITGNNLVLDGQKVTLNF